MDAYCTSKETRAEVRDATIAILERTNFASSARRVGGVWVER